MHVCISMCIHTLYVYIYINTMFYINKYTYIYKYMYIYIYISLSPSPSRRFSGAEGEHVAQPNGATDLRQCEKIMYIWNGWKLKSDMCKSCTPNELMTWMTFASRQSLDLHNRHLSSGQLAISLTSARGQLCFQLSLACFIVRSHQDLQRIGQMFRDMCIT